MMSSTLQLIATVLTQAAAGVAGPFWPTDLKIGLYNNNVTPTPFDLYAEYTPPAFTGYAAVQPTWDLPTVQPNGSVDMNGGLCQFVCTGGTPSDIIYGAILYLTSVDTLLAVDVFAVPIPIALVGAGVNYYPVINLPIQSWGGGFAES